MEVIYFIRILRSNTWVGWDDQLARDIIFFESIDEALEYVQLLRNQFPDETFAIFCQTTFMVSE